MLEDFPSRGHLQAFKSPLLAFSARGSGSASVSCIGSEYKTVSSLRVKVSFFCVPLYKQPQASERGVFGVQ